MDRRGFLRGTLGTLSAAVGAFALGKGVDGRESAPEGVQGQPVMTLVTGPDPAMHAYVEWGPDGKVIAMPSWTPSPWFDMGHSVRGMGIPLTEFPEFDAKHGIVTIFDSHIALVPPDEWAVPMIRAHYLYALGLRTPDRPLDGNHLAVRFMPRTMIDVAAYLDGVKVPGVTESYSGPSGWLVQMVADDAGNVVTFGDSLRSRILTGNVEHWVDGGAVSPGDYTAPLLR